MHVLPIFTWELDSTLCNNSVSILTPPVSQRDPRAIYKRLPTLRVTKIVVAVPRTANSSNAHRTIPILSLESRLDRILVRHQLPAKKGTKALSAWSREILRKWCQGIADIAAEHARQMARGGMLR